MQFAEPSGVLLALVLQGGGDGGVVGGEQAEPHGEDRSVGHQAFLEFLVGGEVTAFGTQAGGCGADHGGERPVHEHPWGLLGPAYGAQAVEPQGVVGAGDGVDVDAAHRSSSRSLSSRSKMSPMASMAPPIAPLVLPRAPLSTRLPTMSVSLSGALRPASRSRRLQASAKRR